jgi:hypothetical protein
VAPADAAATKLDRAALEHERDALSEGLNELARRRERLQQERKNTQRGAARRSLEELKPLCDAYLDKAKEGAALIMESFAALSAIGRATNSNAPGLNRVAEAAAGVRGPGALVIPNHTMAVPDEVVALANILKEKGQAHMGVIPKSVQLHDPENAAAMAEARHSPLLGAPKMRFG